MTNALAFALHHNKKCTKHTYYHLRGKNWISL